MSATLSFLLAVCLVLVSVAALSAIARTFQAAPTPDQLPTYIKHVQVGGAFFITVLLPAKKPGAERTTETWHTDGHEGPLEELLWYRETDGFVADQDQDCRLTAMLRAAQSRSEQDKATPGAAMNPIKLADGRHLYRFEFGAHDTLEVAAFSHARSDWTTDTVRKALGRPEVRSYFPGEKEVTEEELEALGFVRLDIPGLFP